MLHATPISTQVMLRDGKFAVSREGGRHDAAMRAIPAAFALDSVCTLDFCTLAPGQEQEAKWDKVGKEGSLSEAVGR